jgi:hypothetical protein
MFVICYILLQEKENTSLPCRLNDTSAGSGKASPEGISTHFDRQHPEATASAEEHNKIRLLCFCSKHAVRVKTDFSLTVS